jgi:hypothetical protein
LNPKVRLLLDVDGVLNAVTLRPAGVWSDWRVDEINGLPITWSPSVAGFIRGLHDRGVEIVWLTSWGRSANDVLGPVMGLPEFPVAGGCYVDDGWWKLPLAQELYRDLVPFVWLDDDLKYEKAAVHWLKSLPQGEFLAVSPGTQEGIRPGHIEKITAFVECCFRKSSRTDAESRNDRLPPHRARGMNRRLS